MASAELDKLLSSSTTKAPSPAIAVHILSLLRIARLPRPDLVLTLGTTALSSLSARTRAYWDTAEQIVQAAAQKNEHEILQTTVSQIASRFSNSPRAKTLRALTLEAIGRWSDAMDAYIAVIQEEPMAPIAYKRQVAVLKSQMKRPEAIALLNYYLSQYSDDHDAWAELCALCLDIGRFAHAVFAANELVLLDPANHAYHTLAGDVYMTCGGRTNLVRAREHYAASLNVRTHANLRALFGLWLACSRLMDNRLLSGEEAAKNEQLLAVAQKGIRAVYAKLRNEAPFESSSIGNAELVVIETDIVTGKRRAKNPA